LAAHHNYLKTNTGFYATGNMWADKFIDRNGSGCQVDPSSNWNSNLRTLEVTYDVIANRAVNAPSAAFTTGLYVGSSGIYSNPGWWHPGLFVTGDIIPNSGGAYGEIGYYHVGANNPLGQSWGAHLHNRWASWWLITRYQELAYSSETMKKDIRDLGREDLDKSLEDIRKLRSVYYRWNQEDATLEDTLKSAEIAVREANLAQKREAEKAGRIYVEPTADEIRKQIEKYSESRFRPVPHIGVIAESLPRELNVYGRYNNGYGTNDMEGLLMAGIKALDTHNQEMKQQLVDLEDRVALMEQLLVDQGILK
ncbi:MAG: hypothetical protein GXP54_08260, partial [Deltaproteobacteria bacterium]|nr:hypothetical protein [Deltaproteobacteria bacterium]